jgi:hypothetical protein
VKDLRGDLVLDCEDVLELTIVPVAPQVKAGRGVDQLRRDPYLVANLANIALEHVANAAVTTDVGHVDHLPL